MRGEEIHLYGLSRLPLGAAVGLGCPVLVFLRTRTSHKRVFCNAATVSVSCAPYFSLTLCRGSRISTESQGRVSIGFRVRPPVDTGYIYPNLVDDGGGSVDTSFTNNFS